MPTVTMLNTKLVTWTMALFISVSYLICVAFGLATPESIHMHEFLEIVLPGFHWLDPVSFLTGLVESFLWGVYLGMGFSLLYNRLHRILVAVR